MHPTLQQQIDHNLSQGIAGQSPEVQKLLNEINLTYKQFQENKTSLEQSLEQNTELFSETKRNLQSENEIIEQKVAERTRELEYEKTTVNEIAEHMSIGSILINKAGLVTFINNAALTFLHTTRESSTPITDILAATFPTVDIEYYITRSLAGETLNITEIEAGTAVYSLSFVSLKNEGDYFGTLIWINDITAQIVLDRARNQFIAIASHEMRTPLAIIRGNAELLLEEKTIQENEMCKNEITSILKSTVRLLEIVNDFLDVQHLENGKVQLSISPVNITETVNSTIQDLTKIAEEKGIKLTFEESSDIIPTLDLDHFRLQQICINVISNAIHYTEKGFIKVSTELADNHVHIRFQDSGIGISKEDQMRLFKKFQTGQNFLRSREYGSGLGLYISATLATNMGGELTLESSELGKGSTFKLTFPLSLQTIPNMR